MTRKMKDSGIEWIGEIPEDWEIRKLGNISKLYTGNSIKDNEKDNYISPINAIPYIATKDVGFDNKIDYDNGMYIKKDDGKFKRAYRGNTLVCIEGGSAGRKIAKIESEEVCFGNKLCCINSNVISNNYLYYYSLSPNFINGFQSRITGLIPGVTLLEMAQIEIVVPSKHKQKAIANFLDKKTQEIDNIISKTKKAIEEYKRYKQSLITETITKGLDKNVQMKDSEIEWIGKIPEHWDATKLKNVTSKLTDGAHISPDTNEGKYYFVSTVDINNGMIDFNNALKTSKESYEYMVRTGCKPNIEDLLMSKDGTIGKMALVREENNFVVASSLLIISSNTNSIIEYIYYYLMSKVGENQIESYHKGSGLRRISIINTGNILITVPPLQEQKAIASYLDQKCSQIDQIISTKEKLLTEMEAYKKSLIYETVTGKREVE
ncbi:restriction endonuclease subunit S [Clostridium tetani]|uniref:restriction endonuclease subunit S n=1 Tax=Clostridium tetani TaxID=1513 RepID=UPI00131AB68B|nr:restriction endonuclease subunit S [Clostridium tetani]